MAVPEGVMGETVTSTVTGGGGVVLPRVVTPIGGSVIEGRLGVVIGGLAVGGGIESTGMVH